MWIVDMQYAFGVNTSKVDDEYIANEITGVFPTEEKALLYIEKNRKSFEKAKNYSEIKVKIYYIKERDKDLIEIMKETWPEEYL